jgi:heterodisulfide reductase subunit C
MIDFGYQINADRQIDFDKNDKKMLNYIIKNEPTFRICLACGTCSATCTTGSFTNFNIRKIFTLIKRGEYSEAINDINKCMLCGKCTLVCPRAVNTRNLILTIQKAIDNFYIK